MDEQGKNRLTGAVIWLGLLVIVVPIWFSDPVNFKPSGQVENEITAERPLVSQAYIVPESAVKARPTPEVDTKAAEANEQKVSQSKQKQDSSESSKQVVLKTKPVETTKVKEKPRWIVRIIAYRDIRSANDLLGRLEKDYEVYIKSFEVSGVHSVRAGPYFSKAKAEQDRRKLDKMLHAKSEVVQLK